MQVARAHTHAYTHTHKHTHTHTCICMRTYIHRYMHAYMHTHTHTRRFGHIPVLRALLAAPSMRSIDRANDKMQSPLHIAAFKLQREAVALMLQHGNTKTNTTKNNKNNTDNNTNTDVNSSYSVRLLRSCCSTVIKILTLIIILMKILILTNSTDIAAFKLRREAVALMLQHGN